MARNAGDRCDGEQVSTDTSGERGDLSPTTTGH